MDITLRRLVGNVARILFPSYSACGHCGRPWKIVDGHATPYKPSYGCFPLCEDCWGELTIDERLPYYDDLVDRWIVSDYKYHCGNNVEEREKDRIRMREAVLKGL